MSRTGAFASRDGLFLEELNSFSYPVDPDSIVDLLYPIQPKGA